MERTPNPRNLIGRITSRDPELGLLARARATRNARAQELGIDLDKPAQPDKPLTPMQQLANIIAQSFRGERAA